MGRSVTTGAAAVLASAVAVFLLAMLARTADARPSQLLSRTKRLSDHRLAELETLIALKNMRGKLVTVPIGFGKLDPMKLGRKRRSSTESNLQELRRLLRTVVERDDLSSNERSRYARIFARWAEQEKEEEQEEVGDDRDENEDLANLL